MSYIHQSAPLSRSWANACVSENGLSPDLSDSHYHCSERRVHGSVGMSVCACNSKTIAPINLIFLHTKYYANTGRTTRFFCRYNYTFLFGCLLNVCNFQCYII